MSFAQWVDCISGKVGRDEASYRHWVSQHRILGLDIGMEYDQINNFDADITRACEELNLDRVAFHYEATGTANIRTRGRIDAYAEHYTPEMIQKLEQGNAEDISAFGCEFK